MRHVMGTRSSSAGDGASARGSTIVRCSLVSHLLVAPRIMEDALNTNAAAAEIQGEATTRRKPRKKDKVRSAWIAFFGRIVAQFIGAAATVFLGVVVVRSYVAPAPALPQPSAPAENRTDSRPRYAADRTRVDRPLVLAVLPFDNFSGDPRQEHFANAMTEALVARLANEDAVRVISRTSVMRYKGARTSLPDIARELQADIVVEASVATAGDRVRVTAQLIDAATDAHIWARSYDRPLRDPLAVQADVSDAIARDLRGRLTLK